MQNPVQTDGFKDYGEARPVFFQSGALVHGPFPQKLADIQGITPADGTIIVGDGTKFVGESGSTALTSLGVTTAGQALLDDVNAAAQRATIGLPDIFFSVSKGGTAQTGVSNAQVTFGTEIFDIGGYYDTSTSRFTPPAGKYRLSARVLVSVNIADQSAYLLKIRKNGSDWAQTQVRASGTSGFSILVTDVVDANGTDFFDIAYQSGSGSQTIDGAYLNTAFFGERL